MTLKGAVETKKPICITTSPLERAGRKPLIDLVNIISAAGYPVYLISAGDAAAGPILNGTAKLYKYQHRVRTMLIARAVNHVVTELRLLQKAILVARDTDTFIFFLGAQFLVLPTLVLKLLGNEVIAMPGGVLTKTWSTNDASKTTADSVIFWISIFLADKLILYSENMSTEGNLTRFAPKTIFAQRCIVDFNKFRPMIQLADRPKIVGFVGRLSEEKGILNFAHAIRLIVAAEAEIRFVICGEGGLSNSLKAILGVQGLDRTNLIGWVDHDQIPSLLNSMMLLVIPSYSEGLPNVMVEAMACGTPVLATRVGAIPDEIEEGKTGFLLKTNDPEEIARSVIDCLRDEPRLTTVAELARKQAQLRFSKEAQAQKWGRLLPELIQDK
jgi:glycosyltransferase involved in cell wall biosynthesis